MPEIDQGQTDRINKITEGKPFEVAAGQDVEVSIPFNINQPVELIVNRPKKKQKRGPLETTDQAVRISTIIHEKYLSGLLQNPFED